VELDRRIVIMDRMKPTLDLYGLPRYANPKELIGTTAVVIDVLRAATTIAHALHAGAEEVIPCLEIEDALQLAEQFPADQVVLGGEREGVAIDGFALGNSPEEYSPERVAGKTVILTTTNGTRAMSHARAADEVYIAAFVDVSAVVDRLVDRLRISILCAGTDGNFSEDDILLGGLLVDFLQRRGGLVYQLNAQALTAREMWLHAFALPKSLGAESLEPERQAERFRNCLGARSLLHLGLDADILAASQLDRFDFAPRLDTKSFRIKASGKTP